MACTLANPTTLSRQNSKGYNGAIGRYQPDFGVIPVEHPNEDALSSDDESDDEHFFEFE